MPRNYDEAQDRAEQVLRRHGVEDERKELFKGERSKEKIDAIIRDIAETDGAE